VEKPENDRIGPVNFLWFSSVDEVGAHEGVQTIASPKLTGILLSIRNTSVISKGYWAVIAWCLGASDPLQIAGSENDLRRTSRTRLYAISQLGACYFSLLERRRSLPAANVSVNQRIGDPFLTYSARLDRAILRLPHRILYLLHDVVELDSSQALRFRGLGNGHRYRHRHAAQVVHMREKRRAGLAHGHQARHGARRRREHTGTDPAGSRDDSAEAETRIQHGVIYLADDVRHSLVCHGGERAAGGNQRPPVSPGDQIGRVRFGARRRIGEREDNRPLCMSRHFFDD